LIFYILFGICFICFAIRTLYYVLANKGSELVTCPPKRSPVIMLVKQDNKGGINGQKKLHSGADHQQVEGS